eukprot:5742460-Amphidinium_carterae.1
MSGLVKKVRRSSNKVACRINLLLRRMKGTEPIQNNSGGSSNEECMRKTTIAFLFGTAFPLAIFAIAPVACAALLYSQ